jgi:hypothetical protein
MEAGGIHHQQGDRPVIIRTIHNSNFTTISNDILNDRNLCYPSTAVLCYLLSKPSNWKVVIEDIANRGGIGRDQTYKLLNKLITAGYIHRVKTRSSATQKWEKVEYIVFSSPLPENTDVSEYLRTGQHIDKSAIVDTSDRGPFPEIQDEDAEPLPELPPPETPLPEDKDALLNTERLQKTDSTKRSLVASKATKARKTDEELGQIFDEQFWPVYPKRIGGNPKKPARKAFIKAARALSDVHKILDAVKVFAAGCAQRIARKPGDAKFIPMAVTWLNQERFSDDPSDMSPSGGPDGTGGGGETVFDLLMQAERKVRENEASGYSDIDYDTGGHGLIDG